ncbi:hypothetical protein [Dyella telluris]|uniref:Uncharacterized protein n=1 Tax=Dyella telluris TaxID=2763498 RepID=A0A7G8Q895_9GAMM|nr:hypothetical protein [Dyella telluris]QNK03003.1 hypothetical protein H8F01_07805 [Dyella telluris]
MNTLGKVILGLLAITGSLQAGAVGRLVDLSVIDRTTQQELPVYRHDGRYYVAGQPGHRYQIQLRSQEGIRMLGVLSVDGVNALSGDTADWSQAGYVLQPYASADILGWRKSLSEVADFVFADASRSYAARTGRPDNVGVIGIAVFLPRRMIRPQPMQGPVPEASMAERRMESTVPVPVQPAPAAPIVAAPPAQVASTTAPSTIVPSTTAPSTIAPSPTAKARDNGPLGTGHGQRETSVVTTTDFERASSSPNEVITLYYDTRDRLVAQGVIPGDDRLPGVRPDPFPGHFVPDPR